MILPRLGRWTRHVGSRLIWERLYLDGYRWTPFCWVRRRHPKISIWEKARRYDELIECLDDHGLAMLYRKGDELKRTDGEGWTAGYLLQKLCRYAGFVPEPKE